MRHLQEGRPSHEDVPGDIRHYMDRVPQIRRLPDGAAARIAVPGWLLRTPLDYTLSFLCDLRWNSTFFSDGESNHEACILYLWWLPDEKAFCLIRFTPGGYSEYTYEPDVDVELWCDGDFLRFTEMALDGHERGLLRAAMLRGVVALPECAAFGSYRSAFVASLGRVSEETR